MKLEQKAAINGLTGMQRFLHQHYRTMAPVNQSPVRAALDEVLRAIAAQEVAHRTAKLRCPSRLARLGELGEAVRSAHLLPIVRFGRKHAARAPMLGCLRMPARGSTSGELAKAARAIAALVGQHRSLFVHEGFPADFLESMATAVEAVRTAASEYIACYRESDAAVEEIKQLISRGRAIARVLDGLVLARLEANAKLADEWRATTSLRRPEGPVPRGWGAIPVA